MKARSKALEGGEKSGKKKLVKRIANYFDLIFQFIFHRQRQRRRHHDVCQTPIWSRLEHSIEFFSLLQFTFFVSRNRNKGNWCEKWRRRWKLLPKFSLLLLASLMSFLLRFFLIALKRAVKEMLLLFV